MHHYRDRLVSAMKARASQERARWWNDCLKGAIPFMGLALFDIHQVIGEFEEKERWSHLPMNRQVNLVYGLMRGEYAEEKLAAIMFIQLFWLKRERPVFIMRLVSDWFDERYIFDWHTTDWLSVRILTPLLDRGDPEVMAHLVRWNKNPYLWKARASLVPFALARTRASHQPVIRRFADVLIRRDEPYAKTAVGWVMRECSRDSLDFVLGFLSQHVKYTSSEVKRNALKHYRYKPKS